jgi:hypothetical protein
MHQKILQNLKTEVVTAVDNDQLGGAVAKALADCRLHVSPETHQLAEVLERTVLSKDILHAKVVLTTRIMETGVL